MKLAIMQPYFLPYIGYFQLINAVDTFVIYDNIQFTKKGWFNRNRFLLNGTEKIFTISLQKDSDFLNVNEKKISDNYNKKKIVAQFSNAYSKAPYFNTVMPIIEKIINYDNSNLFEYIYNSIKKICKFINIETEIITSSTININHNLKSEEKVISICKALKAITYINPIGGIKLYNKENFYSEDIDLNFIKSDNFEYKQFGDIFIPWLSIIDIIMFNNNEKIGELLNKCSINDY